MCFLSLLGHARRLLSPYLHDIYLLALSLIYLKPAYTHAHTKLFSLPYLCTHSLTNNLAFSLSLYTRSHAHAQSHTRSLSLTRPIFFAQFLEGKCAAMSRLVALDGKPLRPSSFGNHRSLRHEQKT